MKGKIEIGNVTVPAVFYSGTKNASSWAMRAWLALKHAGISFQEQVIDIRRPQRFINLRSIAEFSPSATVPVLVVDDLVIFDSLAIMEYANDLSGGVLLPKDVGLRARARSIVAWQHAGLSRICNRISFESSFYPFKRDLTEGEVGEASTLIGCVDEILACGDGPFLFGTPSLADFSLAPAVIRLTRHEVNLEAWPRTKQWFDAILNDRWVREWLGEADLLPHIWFDDYLVPGLTDHLHPSTNSPSSKADGRRA